MGRTTSRIVAVVLWVVAVLLFVSQAAAREARGVSIVAGSVVFAVFLLAMLAFADERVLQELRVLGSRGGIWPFLYPSFAWLIALLYGLGFAGGRIPWELLLYSFVPVALVLAANRFGDLPNVFDLLAILAVWFPVELDWVAVATLPPHRGIVGMGAVFAMPVALYAFLAVRRVRGMGFRLDLNGFDLKWAFIYFVAFMPFALAIGLPTHFIAPSEKAPGAIHAVGTLVAIFLYTGIPEEVLFRGLMLNLLAQRLGEKGRWKPVSLVVTSVIFGWAHVNNHVPPLVQWNLGPLGELTVPWVYIVLATIAGVFYALAYLKTGKVTVAALVHALVDATWSLALSG